MITGSATVKKPIKFLGDSKFELTLTGVTADDFGALLATLGNKIVYHFNAAYETRGEVREEPQSGTLYNVVNGVVEGVRPANQEETEEEDLGEPIEESDQECPCPTCTHLVDWPDDSDPEKTTKTCEVGLNPEDCDKYDPIVMIGAGEDGEEEPEESTPEAEPVTEESQESEEEAKEETKEESDQEETVQED